jgi:4-hydroxybenzoate polyprenyltransferase
VSALSQRGTGREFNRNSPVATEHLTDPLIVHLEGELVLSDVYWERVVHLIRTRPGLLPGFLTRCLTGVAGSKEFLDAHVSLNPSELCYDRERVEQLKILQIGKGAAAQGAIRITVVSSLPGNIAERLLEYLELPQDCLRTGSAKESASGSPGRTRLSFGSLLANVVNAMRIRHWPKNLLILLPLFAAHRFGDVLAWTMTLTAALAFALVSSSVYLLNDLLDVVNDRAHPIKKLRPFAACTLPLSTGFLLVPLLLAAAVALSVQLPVSFFVVLSAYFVANVGYSFGFKRFHSLDLVLLAAMYTARVLAGGQATGIMLSPWLLAFAVFFFFGLAAAKRYSDLLLSPATEERGRGYRNEDKPAVLALGVSSSLLSSLVLALYLNSPSVAALYRQSQVLWVFLPILVFWISRVWISAARGNIHSDPLLFVMGDRQSHIAGAVALAVFWFAI